MFGGLGGLSSIFGLILQIGLIIIVVRLAMSWWQRRHAPASAYAGPAPGAADGPGAQTSFRTGTASDWDRAARRLRSCRPTTRPSSACSAKSRPHGRTRTSPNCIRWRRPKWCRISPRTSRRTGPATTSTRSPTSSCCRATSRKPGAKAKPTTPAWRCGSRWSTRRSSAAPAGWSRAANSRPRRPRSGPSLRPRGANWELSAIQQTLIACERMTMQGAAVHSAAPFSLARIRLFRRCGTGIMAASC